MFFGSQHKELCSFLELSDRFKYVFSPMVLPKEKSVRTINPSLPPRLSNYNWPFLNFTFIH